MARYGQACKVRIVARPLPPESSSVEQVSREVGVSAATLERCRADALAHGSGDRAGGGQRWTAAARLQALITTAGMDEATRSGWCREQGLYSAELAAWQQNAIAGLGEPRAVSAAEARQDRRRVKDLERELHRKDRALAENGRLVCAIKTYGPPRPQEVFAYDTCQSASTYPACGHRPGQDGDPRVPVLIKLTASERHF